MSHYLPHFPTARIRLLFVDTSLQLRSLIQSVSTHTARSAPPLPPAIPPALLAEARRLLAAVARIMAREKHWCGGLRLEGAPGWPELSARLAFADAALRRFSAIYLDHDDSGDDDESGAPDADSSAVAPRLGWR